MHEFSKIHDVLHHNHSVLHGLTFRYVLFTLLLPAKYYCRKNVITIIEKKKNKTVSWQALLLQRDFDSLRRVCIRRDDPTTSHLKSDCISQTQHRDDWIFLRHKSTSTQWNVTAMTKSVEPFLFALDIRHRSLKQSFFLLNQSYCAITYSHISNWDSPWQRNE